MKGKHKTPSEYLPKEIIQIAETNTTAYDAPWYPNCRHANQFLGGQHVSYKWVYIDQEKSGWNFVQKINDGKQIIAIIAF